MKCFELGAVADADNGCIGKPLQQEPHQLFLAPRIERGGRFVHHDKFWMLDEHAGKRKPLFLSAGEHVFPRRIFIEAIDKMVQTHFRDRLTDHGIVNIVGRERSGAAEISCEGLTVVCVGKKWRCCSLVFPKILESVWSKLGVADGVLDVPVPEVLLDCPGVVPGVRQEEARRVSKHVRVDREW